VSGLVDFEPLAAIKRSGVVLVPVRTLRMTIEHSEHLPAIGDALIDLADG
jgi:hypothetical protein